MEKRREQEPNFQFEHITQEYVVSRTNRISCSEQIRNVTRNVGVQIEDGNCQRS